MASQNYKFVVCPWYRRFYNLARELWFPKLPPHLVRGKKGEAFAAQFLRECGYKILTRNVRFEKDEIDIVARERDGTLVFVEVKTRSDYDVRGGYADVDARKRHALSRAIKNYLRRAYWRKKPWRVDVVVVTVADSCGNGKMTAEQIKGISLFKK